MYVLGFTDGYITTIPSLKGNEQVIRELVQQHGVLREVRELPKDICPECGAKMVAESGCYTCYTCGYARCG